MGIPIEVGESELCFLIVNAEKVVSINFLRFVVGIKPRLLKRHVHGGRINADSLGCATPRLQDLEAAQTRRGVSGKVC